MHHGNFSENIGGSLWGAGGTILGSILGWINYTDILQTAIMAVLGAAIGFYTNKLLKWIHK